MSVFNNVTICTTPVLLPNGVMQLPTIVVPILTLFHYHQLAFPVMIAHLSAPGSVFTPLASIATQQHAKPNAIVMVNVLSHHFQLSMRLIFAMRTVTCALLKPLPQLVFPNAMPLVPLTTLVKINPPTHVTLIIVSISVLRVVIVLQAVV